MAVVMMPVVMMHGTIDGSGDEDVMIVVVHGFIDGIDVMMIHGYNDGDVGKNCDSR